MRTGMGGGRRELNVTCPECNFNCMLPPAAIARNQFFCSGCGKQLDLKTLMRQLAAETVALGARNDRENKYKSARKAAARR